MSIKDGYDRVTRLKKSNPKAQFTPMQTDETMLLERLFQIAPFIKYYTNQMKHEGGFDELLPQLKKIREGKDVEVDGTMEPAQALLYTFIKNLNELNKSFNKRWDDLSQWYIDCYLQIASLPKQTSSIWLGLATKTETSLLLPPDFTFVLKDKQDEKHYYKTQEEIEIQPIQTSKIYTLCFDKRQNIYPAKKLRCVSSVRFRDVLRENISQELLFGDHNDLQNAKSIGFMISSPALLLREGRRSVSLSFLSETDDWQLFLTNLKLQMIQKYPDLTEEIISVNILKNIFYLNISTEKGWETIVDYALDIVEEKLFLRFTLLESFSALVPCRNELHAFESKDPCLQIRLNFDAWLYPYSWLKLFLLKTIWIEVDVEDVLNILVYNNLGRVDTAKPFIPFGTNTDCGTWMIIGNYEMAQKNTTHIDVKIQWEQLPLNGGGLQAHYAAYKKNIDDNAFKIRLRFLQDYKWQNIREKQDYNLFQTEEATMSSETVISCIPIEKMPIVQLEEEAYDYTINSKTGFISIVLTSPDIGFGDTYYRTLYSDTLVHNIRKKRIRDLPNSPIRPLVNRISINYKAIDRIDMRTKVESEASSIYHISEFGYKRVYPNSQNIPISLTFSLEADTNLMLFLEGVKGGETLRLYFDFYPLLKLDDRDFVPYIQWYIGNGYDWEKVADDGVLSDGTNSLQNSGLLKIRFPDRVENKLRDENGQLILMASVFKYGNRIPNLKGVYVNALELIVDEVYKKNDFQSKKELNLIDADIQTEILTPTLSSMKLIRFSGQHLCEERFTERKIRVAESISHGNRAVSARDYERIVLQAFPAIAKVKCLSYSECRQAKMSELCMVVIPQNTENTVDIRMPKVSVSVLSDIKNYLLKRTSSYVDAIKLINPDYEEIKLRLGVTFTKKNTNLFFRGELQNCIKYYISPWLEGKGYPKFGQVLSLQTLYAYILRQEYVNEIKHLGLIRIKSGRKISYDYYEYKDEEILIYPTYPYSVFVPSDTHLFTQATQQTYGIEDMEICDTFIIE